MHCYRLRRAIVVTGLGLVVLGCATTDVSETNKALVRAYMEEIINVGDFTAVDRLFPDSGFVLNDRLFTRDDFPTMLAGLRHRFPDFHLTVEDQVAEGSKVVTRVTFSGTHRGEFMGIAPSGRVVEYTGIAIDSIANGKVVRGWHQSDEFGMLSQLGFLPQN